MKRHHIVAAASLALAACHHPAPPGLPDLSTVAVQPPPGTLHRLSIAQYNNTIHDLISPSIVIPPELEPDVIIGGLTAIGMSTATISPLGVQLYEQAALSISSQAIATPAGQQSLVACTPKGVTDQTCLTQFVTAFGRRAWRRPLTSDEVTQFVGVGASAASVLNDPWKGIAASLAALLQSPNFLFRVELGEPDPSGSGYRYSSLEMASRLSYFLTNSTPDAALQTAAEAGDLVTDAGLQAQVTRLLASSGAHTAIKNFFTELYQLDQLSSLSKDPTVYVQMSSDFGADAEQETLSDLDQLVLSQNGDFRTFLTGQSTIVNPRLAALYDVAAPSLTGFAAVTLPASSPRRGFFGQASFLALQAHPTTTSPVLRGKFIRNVMLCEVIPPPPVNVNTGLEPASAAAPTMRQRDAEHLLLGATCSGCHSQMDPIGLGFENFDGIGAYRTTENGFTIDASGVLDGTPFRGPVDLAQDIVQSPKFPACLATNVFQYATGTVVTGGDSQFVSTLGSAFVTTGYHVRDLLEVVAMSSGFRRAGAPQP